MANPEFLEFNIFINGNAPKNVSLKNGDPFNLKVEMTFRGRPQYSGYNYKLIVRLDDDNLSRQPGELISTAPPAGGAVQILSGNKDWTGKYAAPVAPETAANIVELRAAEWELKFDESGTDEVISVTLPLQLSVTPKSEHLDHASIEIMCVIFDEHKVYHEAVTAAFNSIAFVPIAKSRPRIESAVVRVDDKGDVRLEGEVSNGGKEYTIKFANQGQTFSDNQFSLKLNPGRYEKETMVIVEKNAIDEDSRIPTYDSDSLLKLSVEDNYPSMVLRNGKFQLHLSVATKERFEFPSFTLEWSNFNKQLSLEAVAHQSIAGKTATIDILAHLTEDARVWDQLSNGHFSVTKDEGWTKSAPKPVTLNVRVVPAPVRLYGEHTIYGDNKNITLELTGEIPPEVADSEDILIDVYMVKTADRKGEIIGNMSFVKTAGALRQKVELALPSEGTSVMSDKSSAVDYEIQCYGSYERLETLKLSDIYDSYFSNLKQSAFFHFIYDPEVPQISAPQIDLDLSNDNLVVYKPGSIKYKEALPGGRPSPRGDLWFNPSDKVTLTITQDPQDPTKYSIGFAPFPVANLNQGFSPTDIIMTLDERDPFPVPFSMDFPKWAVSLKLYQIEQEQEEENSLFKLVEANDGSYIINSNLDPRVVLKTNIRLSHFWLYLKKPQSVGWKDVGDYWSFAAENVNYPQEVTVTPMKNWNSASGQFLKVEAKDSSKSIPPGTTIEFELSGRLTIPPDPELRDKFKHGVWSTEFAVAPWSNDTGFRKDSLATVGNVTFWGTGGKL